MKRSVPGAVKTVRIVQIQVVERDFMIQMRRPAVRKLWARRESKWKV